MHRSLSFTTFSRRLIARPDRSAAGVLACVVAALMQPSMPAPAVAHEVAAHTQLVVTPVTQDDSVALLRRLQAAQRDLERVRRQSLPFAIGSTAGRCDERIGRFCYWYDDDDPWTPPPDHERFVTRRDEFLARLDSAIWAIPSDRWVSAQRVRYLVDARRMDRAMAAAHDCSASGWWCAALVGYVHHHAGEYAVADSVFRTASRLMSEQQRREWSDLSLLLTGRVRGRYGEMNGGDREDFERRFWWLADPFYAIPGNERRSEHFYRLVINQMLEESSSPRRMRWGNDNRELLVRFGEAIGWERRRVSGSMSVSDASIVGYHRNGGRQFVPPDDYLDDHTAIAAGQWDIDPERATSRYAIPRFSHYSAIEYQIATFKRGDSTVVVLSGGWKDSPETASVVAGRGSCDSCEVNEDVSHDTLQIALALARDEHCQPSIATAIGGRPVSVTVAREPTLASIEVWNTRDSIAGRDRDWLDLDERLPDGFAASDLLLLAESDSLPGSLDQAIPLSRASYNATPGESIGLYWEVYGVDGGTETVHSALTVAKLGRGFLRRAAEWAGIVGRREDTVRLRWSEEVTVENTIVPQAIAVRLEPSMNGEYLLKLVVRRASGETASVERRIRVR